MKNLNEKRPSGLALLPFAMFIFIYMGAGIYYQVKGMEMAFYQFPSVTAMFLAVLVAFIMFKGTINEKFDTFAKGAANVDILTMLMIYILAGAFANVAAVMGGRESTVNLGLSLVPVEFLAAGLFVISAFMGTATGSSMGTVTAVIPIAVGIAEKGGLSLTVVIGAVVGGAMFGDNLSMISDTTIAATRSQRCEMRDKFRVNFLIALPAALITLVLLLIFGRPETVMPLEALPFDLIKVLPYVLVLVLALCGLNVFLALTVGIFSAGLVGICCGDLTIAAFAQSVWDGFTGMNEVFFLTLLCGGMSELIAKNGGIAWIIQKLRKVMKGNKSAQVGIAAMVSLCDCATANNTVAIVMAGPIAKEVAENLIRAVVGCPNGVQKMSVSMPGLVQTSSNLARVVSDGKTVKLQCLLRSSVNSEKEELGEAISAVFELAGAKVELTGAYNGWKPNLDSPILAAMKASYKALFGKEPAVTAIHAGLECGIIGTNYPKLDMISSARPFAIPTLRTKR